MTIRALLFVLLSIADKGAFTAIHDDAMQRARVWEEPAVAIEAAKLGSNPDDTFDEHDVVECTFKVAGVAGSTPKFDCELAGGEVVKVKYGRSNPEVYAEVAATRLLAALGFPTDRMYVVKRVHCVGCPPDPFPRLAACVNTLTDGASVETCFPGLDLTRAHNFDTSVIERPIKGRRIEAEHERGWSWEELKSVDPVKGGATRAEIDALRLLAVLLGHWDNKAKNQRLLCQGEKKTAEGCARPLAMVQDLGATFGPMKLDLARWSQTRIWTDAASCKVSMQKLPYGGSTFPDAYITEEGRMFLAGLLRRLSAKQIHALFEGARVAKFPHRRASARKVDNWVRVFQAKVRAIVDRPPCPELPVPTVTQEWPAPRQ